jgi:hypothetical protein
MVQIYEVDTRKRRDVNRFIQIHFDLYRGDPVWIPPLWPDARFQLNRDKHPFHRHNEAAFFIAVKDGKDVGRIAVYEPQVYNNFKGTRNGHFFLFDCINDQEVTSALLDQGFAWCQERGLNVFRGPLGFMALDGIGMLADGFENRPAISIPYNYDYYPRLVEQWGFELEERVYSGYLDVQKAIEAFPERILRLSEKIKQRYGFTIKTFKNKRELRSFAAPRLADLYNRTLTHIAGDPPITQEEVDAVADGVFTIIDPGLLKFVMKDDQIVGFLFCFLNIAEGLRKSRGRLYPFGFIHILRDLNKTDFLDLNGMGMAPEYQGSGGTALMYGELFKALKENTRFKHADLVQISEFNVQSLNEVKGFGWEIYKTHHIYRREIMTG